ncbi:MAG: alpha/beta fold hydrolase [Treponemataceae bacterium]
MEKIETGGVSLAYEFRGKHLSSAGAVGQGAAPRPVVVLLNGIAMSIPHWNPISDALIAAGYAVLLHDMRGQLLSDKPEEPYSLELHAEDLAALLDALGIGAAAIVGTSYGAEVGLTFARDYPERCPALVLIDGVSELDAVLAAAADSWKRAALLDPSLFYRVILPWNYSAEWLAANAAVVAKREAAVAQLPREYFEAFARLCDAFLAIDLTKDLGSIQAPTLVVEAEKDILKHRFFANIMVKGIRGARYAEVTGAGHAVVIEKPMEVSRLIAEFLSSRFPGAVHGA